MRAGTINYSVLRNKYITRSNGIATFFLGFCWFLPNPGYKIAQSVVLVRRFKGSFQDVECKKSVLS